MPKNEIDKSWFADITVSNNKQTSSNLSQLLKCRVGNTYTVRLLPNFIDKTKQPFFHYYSHGWNSMATGTYISAISPSTWGERDPIIETRMRLQKFGTDQEKEQMYLLNRKENWLANVYVINDPENPDNNGQIKILRFGKQLYKIIHNAVEGEDKEEFGSRVWDLSKDGCSLKIKVEEQGGYATYVSSRFESPKAIPGLNDSDSMLEVYNNIHNLEETFPVKSYDELKDMLDEHYFCAESNKENSQGEVQTSYDNNTTSYSNTQEVKEESTDYDKDDSKVKDILASMDL